MFCWFAFLVDRIKNADSLSARNALNFSCLRAEKESCNIVLVIIFYNYIFMLKETSLLYMNGFFKLSVFNRKQIGKRG